MPAIPTIQWGKALKNADTETIMFIDPFQTIPAVVISPWFPAGVSAVGAIDTLVEITPVSFTVTSSNKTTLQYGAYYISWIAVA